MKRILTFFMSIALVFGIAGCGNTSEPQPEEGTDEEVTENKGTIILGKSPYEHIWFIDEVIREIAEDRGYTVKLSEGDIGIMFLGLSSGDIDVYADVWTPTLHGSYTDKYEEDIEILNTLYEDAEMGWAVPTYMDIDSIEDVKELKDELKGKITGIEPGSGIMLTTDKALEEYELKNDFEVTGGSTPAMLAEVKRATNNEEPIVFLAWRPHTMMQLFDVKLLDDPKGVFDFDDVKTGVNKNFEEKAPDMHHFFKSFEISKDDIEEAMVKMDEGTDESELAKEWVEKNKDDIDKWFEE